MSVRIMTAVWCMDLPDSDKLVLLALADCANDEGHCWPSVASLVRKCSKSERTIQGSIKRLVDEGHLIRREVPGKGCNYTVLPRNSCAPAKNAPPQGTAQTPAAAADKPSRTINTEAKASLARVVESYNSVAKECGYIVSKVQDASLRQKIRLRLKEHGEEVLLDAIRRLKTSKWIREQASVGKWRPDLDWLMTPAKLRKVIEGTYGEEEDRSAAWSAERRAEYLRSLQGQEGNAASVGSVAAKILGGLH